jgi:hypothetical protein
VSFGLEIKCGLGSDIVGDCAILMFYYIKQQKTALSKIYFLKTTEIM